MWPVRPKIQEGESLTSWLTRVASVYDYKPYQLYQIALGKKIGTYFDFDIKIKNDGLKGLANLSGHSFRRLKEATLIDEYYKWDRETKIWLDSRIYRPARHARVVFCPKCITNPEQKNPYLKKEWRFSYNVVCRHHNVKLIDQCTICHTPFNLSSPFLLHKNLQVCPNCKQPIEKMATACSDEALYNQMVINEKKLTSNIFSHLSEYVFLILEKKAQEVSSPKPLEPIDPNLQQLWEKRTIPLGEVEIQLRYELMKIVLPMYQTIANRSPTEIMAPLEELGRRIAIK